MGENYPDGILYPFNHHVNLLLHVKNENLKKRFLSSTTPNQIRNKKKSPVP